MMKRLKRYTDEINRSELDPHSNLRESDWKCGLNSSSMSIMGFFVVIMMILSVMFSISVILKDPPSDGVSESLEVRVLQVNSQIGMKEEPSNAIKEPANKLLDSLLSDRIDAKSCLSRYHPLSHLKDLIHRPSPYLIAKLRNYESLHKRCGPYTESYNKTLDHLRSNHDRGSSSDCNYLVWISFSGLGNRILTLASAFLYALLTNRVLLVDPGTDMPDLFCEPFPEVSWFLPLDFPLKDQFNSFNQQSPQCYGKIIKNNINNTNNPNEAFIMRPSFVYLHLVHDYDDQDKLFFCDQEQSLLQKVPWLVMKTDNYFIPSLFLIPSFEDELNNLFPNKETVFHFLGRYLFHPTNSVWGLITRYYYTYLANADEKMGIQIRVFDTGPGPFQHVLDQILACTFTEKLLPKITKTQHIITSLSKTRKTKAVLMTSLSSGYFEKVRDLFWEQATVNGEVVGIFQPSHEEHQQTQKANHNQKAWAEMYLLSLTDMLVTSSWSTFGYVAQGLGGLKPWILYKPENRTAPDPPCRRAMSMEPCFHAPPFYDCKAKRGIDTGEVVPHVRHCEDMSWGLKLVDQ